MRLGVYSDLIYRRAGDGTVSADRAFIRFVTALPPRVDEVVVFGRLDPTPGAYPYVLPTENVRFVPLPHYPSVFHVWRLLGALRGSSAVFARELERLDAVWLFGPHPLALAFALISRRKSMPLVLGVRQDYPAYIRNRLPSRVWTWALGAAWVLEAAWRALARTTAAVTVGEELARKYRHGHARILATGLSLVSVEDVLQLDSALARPWDGELRLLTVGRLDPEKNPLLLLDVLRELRLHDKRWRLTIAGDGPLRDALEQRVAAESLEDAVELAGYVSNGPTLWELYRASHAFLHVSLTEGVPQVLWEAQAAGLPVVATDVGGVAVALAGTGLLVPPRNATAAVAALERIRTDPTLRRSLIEQGLENARRETMEAQLDRIAEMLGDVVRRAER